MIDDIDDIDGIDDETVERSELVDRTVVVDRGRVDDATVVVERRARAAMDESATVDGTAVEGTDEDRTVVVVRDGHEDRTVAVPRQRRGAAPAAPVPDPVINLLPRKRGPRTAPVEPGFGRQPVEPVGANAVETYTPREIAPPPLLGPAVPRGGEALRAPAPSMPSVARLSRTAGVVALLVFAGACVVSAVGVVAIIVWFVRG